MFRCHLVHNVNTEFMSYMTQVDSQPSFKCYKLFFLKSPKRCEPHENNNHKKRYKKDVEKGGGGIKNEKCKIVYTIKLFTFIFCIWKRIYLLENIVWENVVYIITNLAKFF